MPQCSHDHARCSTCVKIFLSLDTRAEVKKEINDLPTSVLPSIEKYLLIEEHELDAKNHEANQEGLNKAACNEHTF